jgi:carboxymethylenebutenolidase
MQMKKADDFHPEVLRWFDRYVHGDVDRRGFLHGVARYATGGVTATMLLDLLNPRFAFAQQVSGNDPRIVGKMVDYASPDGSGTMRGYLVRPANATGKLPGILVVHENRGLNPHIQDIARRLAADGFMALSVDFLSPMGGTPADEDKARDMIGTLDAGKVVSDADAAVAWLKARPDSNGKVGMVGFCWGGGIVGRAATADPDLDAAVVFYGLAPDTSAVASIKAPLLLHYAGLDDRINASVPGFEEALKKGGKTYTLYRYEGVNHAFNNDTSAGRYDEAAAMLAWQRTIDFFKKNLS